MSLTSYRAAPPRVGDGVLVYVSDWLVAVCVTRRVVCRYSGWFGRPGGDRLSRILRCSIIGAGVFHGRVRDGIGWIIPRHGHQVVRANRYGWWTCVGLVRVRVCLCVRESVYVLVVCG